MLQIYGKIPCIKEYMSAINYFVGLKLSNDGIAAVARYYNSNWHNALKIMTLMKARGVLQKLSSKYAV